MERTTDPYAPREERVERTRSFDVWHEVPLVPQRTGMSCWAAAAAMLLGWRDATHVDPEAVARGAGRWKAYRDGLRPSDVASFARHWGLRVEPARTYSVAALRRLLETNGPLWMGEASPGLHVVVVSGMVGDGTPDGTRVRVLDPWPDGKGERYVVTFAELMRSFESVARVVGVHAQVLHTGGRGSGGRGVHSTYREIRESFRVATEGGYGAPIGLFVFCRSRADDVKPKRRRSSAMMEDYAQPHQGYDDDGHVEALGGPVAAGQSEHSNTPVLREHNPTAQPDLVLRWNNLPANVTTVDVVLHLHGFSGDGAGMSLVNKARDSGLDLGSRTRPTLGIIPRGKHAPNADTNAPYHFPIVYTEAGVRRLVDHAMTTFSAAHGLGTIQRGRFIVTAHSGGGAALNRLLAATATTDLDPHEVQCFDALYGDATALIRWIGRRVARDRANTHLAPGGMRVFFMPASRDRDGNLAVDAQGRRRPQTETQSRRVLQEVGRILGADAQRFVRRYAVEVTSGVSHPGMPARFGARLLERSDVDLAPNARVPGPVPRPRTAAPHGLHDDEEHAGAEGLDLASDTAQWNNHPRVHRHFTGGLDGYLRMLPLFRANGIDNPAEYLTRNIVTVRFFSRSIPAHRDFQAPFAAAERALTAIGYTPPITSFWSFNVRPIRGTSDRLSKHAVGRAVDINPSTNPRITNADDYRVLHAVTGIDMTRRSIPLVDLEAANRLFRERYAVWLRTLDPAVPAQAELRAAATRRRAALEGYATHGFLDLDRRLIEALKGAGLVWGGDWGTAKDFMHFELRNYS